ncbi:unnamed protein product [Dracunculus medinensis]|uniref:Uncharacterized protein n=1 Tax=Dracunculus medinensis TaxID=318479 RepID=A0A0N4U8N6_DRAME|nr:unnamed protein product [Dracunculus medinensis]
MGPGDCNEHNSQKGRPSQLKQQNRLKSPITELEGGLIKEGDRMLLVWFQILLLLCIASTVKSEPAPTGFDRQDRDYRPLQFGKRDGYRPLQFGKKSFRPLQFGKRGNNDFPDYLYYYY